MSNLAVKVSNGQFAGEFLFSRMGNIAFICPCYFSVCAAINLINLQSEAFESHIVFLLTGAFAN